jgi:uncharacterized membrane protein
MAGIGIRLHRLVADGTYVQAASAYVSSAIIVAGPWLSSVFWLGLLGSASVTFLNASERALVLSTITYAFCASLIVTGGLQLVVTRYLSDRLYLEDEEALAPACTGVLLAAIPLLLLALPFVVLAPFDLSYRLLAASLFMTVSLVWLVVVFLSATRDYVRIVLVFICSYGLSVLAAFGLGHMQGTLGTLFGFTLGQVMCLCLLVSHVYLEFQPAHGLNLDFLAHARRYGDLLLLGLSTAMGLWIDNILFWFSGNGVVIAHFYHTFPAYDVAKLVAFLSTIPAAAVFLVRLETTFDLHCQTFYRLVVDKGVLADIVLARNAMQRAARSTVVVILKLQLLVDMFVLLFAPDVVRLLGLPAGSAALLRVLALGTSCQVVLMIGVLLLLYLDARKPALKVALMFAGSSAAFTLFTLRLGPLFYGTGYLAAAALSALTVLLVLRTRLQHLECLTFMLQPLDPER